MSRSIASDLWRGDTAGRLSDQRRVAVAGSAATGQPADAQQLVADAQRTQASSVMRGRGAAAVLTLFRAPALARRRALVALAFAVIAALMACIVRGDESMIPDREEHYNVKVGTARLQLSGVARVEWDDNVDRRERDAEASTSLDSGLHYQLDWPLSEHFTLAADFETVYRSALSGRSREGWRIEGGTDTLATVGCRLAVGQSGRIEIRDALSHDTTSTFVTERANAEDFSIWDNELSLLYSTDLRSYITLDTEIDRTDTWSGRSRFDYIDNTEHSIRLSVGWLVSGRLTLAPFVEARQTAYWRGGRNDSEALEGGLSIDLAVGETSYLRAAAGYERMEFVGAAPADIDHTGSPSFSLGLSMRPRPLLTHSIGVTRSSENNFTGATNARDRTTVRYSLTWRPRHKWDAAGYVEWARSDASSVIGENTEIYSTGVSISYELSPMAALSLHYDLTDKRSDAAGSAYVRNVLSVSFTYTF